jgi:hypothetical protein
MGIQNQAEPRQQHTILQRFEMSTAYGVQTPLDPNVRLDGQQGGAQAGQQGGVEVDPTQYQAIVGSLMYAALGTRPDITYAVAALSRYNSRPLAVHLTAAKRVLRYLKATKAAKLWYTSSADYNHAGTSEELHGYTDADWAGDSADRKSQKPSTSPVRTLFEKPSGSYSWPRMWTFIQPPRKQPPRERPPPRERSPRAKTDAEKWLQQLAKDVNIRKTAAEKTTADAERTTADAERTTAAMESVTLYCDNQGAIKTIVSGTSKASTKHIDVRFHFTTLGTHMPPLLSTAPTSQQTRTRRIYAQRHWRHLATDIWWKS